MRCSRPLLSGQVVHYLLIVALALLLCTPPVLDAASGAVDAGAVTAVGAPPTNADPPIDAPAFDQAATSEVVYTDNVRARLIAEQPTLAPGGSVEVALVLDIRPHWHTYWRNPGDSGEPPRILWSLPDGLDAGPIRWSVPDPIPVGPLVNYGYSDRAVHLVRLALDPGWPMGEPVAVAAEATWLVCEEACIPEQGSFMLILQTGGGTAAASVANATGATAALFETARSALPSPGVVAGNLSRRADALELRVPAAALPEAPSDLYFFADEWGLVNHAAAQGWSREGQDLLLRLEPGEAVAAVAASGLLRATTADGPVAVRVDATGTVPVSEGTVLAADAGVDAAEDANLGLPLALLFALLGGLVLNLMPCVFPVLAIKALGLASQGGLRLRHRLLHGLAYTGGVLAFFLGLGVLLLGLRAAGAAVGWGFQLQSPLFVLLMAYLFVVLGLSLAGAVTIGAGLMGVGQGMGHGPSGAGPSGAQPDGHLGAFFTGGLAALVAAPCTAPFMGAALSYAMTVAWPIALAILMALGLGMALPLLLLMLWPRLARALPRSGPWMETLKQGLAFPMFATAAWLFWVLTVQTGATGLAAGLAGALALAFGLWLREHMRLARSPWPRLGAGSALVGLVAALWLGVGVLPPPATGQQAASSASAAQRADDAALAGEPYSADALASARAEGRPVFVNMTAAWCITCLVNERVALSRPAVARTFREQDVLYLKGDWTNRDAAITDYLAGFGRNGVPIYVYYPTMGPPKVLPQILTEALVIEGIGAG